MNEFAFLAGIGADLAGKATEIARNFGVDWPYFIAQCVSFCIVAALLHKFAYKPVLTLLAERRKRIAEGLANAEKIKQELARAQQKVQELLNQAGQQSSQMIEEARAAAARVQEQETQKAIAAAKDIVDKARQAIYPFAYRTMELVDGKLFIDTHFVTSVPGNPDLAAQSRSQLETVTFRVAKNRIKNLGVSFPVQTEDALVKLIVKMNLMHVHGDEAPDEEMKEAIREFAELLGSEETDSDFQLDFPPTDNRLVIDLTEKVF